MIRKGIRRYDHENNRRKCIQQGECIWKGTGQYGIRQYFIWRVFFKPLTEAGCPVLLANVTFEPGCRNNWHIPHADKGGGQILICTAGEGWYQEEGKEASALFPEW